ncbi:hypothetical protein [Flavobacterium sp. FlaQc-50]|uniref:hypothetical protein n=1 Tax=unclassified Flavobacterium TaxID=196869 RepID=UPI003757936F
MGKRILILKKVKDYLKRILGISELEIKVLRLEKRLEKVIDKHDELFRMASEVTQDNRVILRHIKFINSHFFVASDIGFGKYEPTVVLIFYRGSQEIVKSFKFENHTVEHIHKMIEGFGKESNHVDQPRGFPKPRFRY